MTAPTVVTFDDPLCLSKAAVGGKAVGLAEMTAAGFPVAPGFAVTTRAFQEFLALDHVRAEVDAALDTVAGHDPVSLAAAGERLHEILLCAELPAAARDAISAAYARLCATTGIPDVAVAVRSSATAEDSVGASFAGEFETWVDVVGAEAVIEHVRKCYASVYSARVLSYLGDHDISPRQIEMAVVVQKTVRARAAGVMFTLSPITGDRSKISIEASWGLGLSVVGGEVTPDRFLVDKVSLTIGERVPGDKRIEYRRGDASVEVERARWAQLCLTDEEVTALAAIGKQLERRHGGPQDIEFAIDEELPGGEQVVLLQCRPETVWSRVERKPAFTAGAGLMSWITGSVSGGAAGAPGHAHDHTHDHSASPNASHGARSGQ